MKPSHKEKYENDKIHIVLSNSAFYYIFVNVVALIQYFWIRFSYLKIKEGHSHNLSNFNDN